MSGVESVWDVIPEVGCPSAAASLRAQGSREARFLPSSRKAGSADVLIDRTTSFCSWQSSLCLGKVKVPVSLKKNCTDF